MKGFSKRFMALLLCLCLMLSVAPMSAFAATDESSAASSDSGVSVSVAAADDESEAEAEEESDEEEAEVEEDANADESDEDEAADESDTGEAADDETGGLIPMPTPTTIPPVTKGSVSVSAAAVEESTAAMPAVTLTKTADEDSGITVTVAAPEGAFAEGVTMTVETLTGDDAEEFLAAVAEQDFALYDETYTVIDSAILDITFYVDGVEIQPATDVTVTISGLDLATEADGLEAGYALIYHMDDEGNVEYVEAEEGEEVGLDSYTFTASDFSDYGIVNVNVEYGLSVASVSSNAGNAGHIDIGVDATASVTIGSTTYSNTVSISSTDFTSGAVTITATQGTTTLTGSSSSSDWRRSGSGNNATYTITNSSVDFVYNLSDLSSSSGSSGITQVRIGGCFPVGSSSNPVEYTLTLTKTVRLYAGGNTSSSDYIDVTVTLTATFGYWDSDNDCPGLNNSWSNGGFSGTSSGLDFVLSMSSTTRPMVTVTKVVQDEDGNVLTEASGQTFSYTITSVNNNVSTQESDTVTVGSSGVGVTVTDVTNSSNFTIVETGYPETIGNYTYLYNTVTYDGSTATITNVYGVETIDIPVTKVWSDDDYDGYRPDEIVVTLLANNSEAKDDAGDTITLTLNESNNWSGTFTDLPVYDDSGDAITYTIAENTVSGYTSSISGSASEGYTIINTLQTGSLTLTKVVKADSSIDTSNYTFTFYVVGNNGELDNVTSVSDGTNSYSVSGGVATVTVSADSSVTLVNLPVGSYTVYETSGTTVTANGYTWTVSGDNGSTQTVTADTTPTATITNTITGTSVVTITKNWDDQSNYWDTRPINDGTTFAVTLTATGTNGETYTYTTTATWVESTNSWTLDLSGVTAFDTEGNMLTYTVTETEVDGYTLEETSITVTPASDRNVSLTNTLKTANVTVRKIVLDSDGNELDSTENDDDFRFALYDDELESYGTVTLGAGESYTFENIPLGTYSLTEYLVGSHDHSYDTTVTVNGDSVTVTERYDSDAQVKYHTVTFTLDDSDEGTTVSVIVTNQEEEIKITEDNLNLFLQGTKCLVNDDIETIDGLTFTYSIYDGNNNLVATGTTTTESTAASSTSSSTITWTILDEDAFTYDEVGTYYYTIVENVTATGGIVYDTARYNLIVAVSKDGNGGGLIAEATLQKYENNELTNDAYNTVVVATTEDNYVPTDTLEVDWTNTYDPSDASIILRAYKNLEGRTLTAGEFTAIVTEYDDDTYSGTETVIGTQVNGTNGYMSLEIVYTEEDAGLNADGSSSGTFVADTTGSQGVLSYGTLSKTHYYTVTEAVPDGATLNSDGTYTYNSVTYDVTTYYIQVTVSVYVQEISYTAPDGSTYGYYTRVGAVTVSSAYYSTDCANWTDLFAYNSETQEYDEVTLTFTNTYVGTGYGTLSTYKVMQGRDFNAGETFTFLIEALDSSAPTLVDPGTGVIFVDNGDGTYTVTVTVADDVADGTTVLNEMLAGISVDQDDVGTYVYRVTEVSASDDNGMTLDTATYGHLITVYVTDNGNGTVSVTTESTNDTDWNGDGVTDTVSSVIVNNFDQGSMAIYGTKVWVDGGASHDNTSEVTLTLYYSIDGTNWYVYTGEYTVTWGTVNTNDWHILNLPVYDEDGNKLYYRVVETYSSSNNYTITYGDNGSSVAETIPEDNNTDNRYTITNTIVQEEVSISGTKTWVEPTSTNHDNANELVLTVTRNSDDTGVTTLTQATGNGDSSNNSTYIVVWSGDTYYIYWYFDEAAETYVGLPLYDASGYTYSYSVTESYAADYADNYANYEIETDWELVSDTEVTFDFTNRAPDDSESDPTKTEDGTIVNDSATVNGKTVVEYGEVAVGDYITYTISYYNNANDTATVRITDPLDSGVDFVSASYGGVTLYATDTGDATSSDVTISYNSTTHTVTWEIETAAFTSGSVTVTVLVNSSARSIASGETAATVDNQATVYNTVIDHTATTEIVSNPLEDDADETAGKGIISVTYEDEVGNEFTRTETDSNNNYYVCEGDEIHYIISRYNNTNKSATFVIVDTLDEGVTYTYSSYGSTYDDNARTVTVTVDGTVYSYDVPARSVVWIVTTNPYSYATVQMTVTVNSSAKTATQTYNATEPGTYYSDEGGNEYTNYTYGVDNTTASVANQTVVYSVGNDVVSYTNVVENPLDEDDAEDPTKTISDTSEGYTDSPEVSTDGTTETYDAVKVNSFIEYVITYYNHYNEAVDIIIEDELDEGVDFISATGVNEDDADYNANSTEADYVSYTYDDASHTVTWTIHNATPLTEDYVVLVVQVNENAKITEANEDTATVENQATVTVGTDNSVSTKIVVNPIDPDTPSDPEKIVSSSSEAGVSGAAVQVGDEITYIISYYNYNNTTATVTITDELENGLSFVKALDENGAELTDPYDETTRTVTWNIASVPAFTGGTVTLVVEVNENALTKLTVSNIAEVTVDNDSRYTNEPENPVDDEPEDPTKTETTINGETVEAVSTNTDDGTITYGTVSVGDEITYTITYYNYYSSEVDITITDQLDPGVEFVSATDQTGATLTADDVFADADDTYVKWPVFTAATYESGSVTLTVRVTEDAKTAGDGLSTEWADSATVDNQASVQISNDSAVTTNIVTNPLDPDEPTEPEKTVDVGDGTSVSVGDTLVYTISYYNNLSTAATVVIEDELDEGVDFKGASNDGVYDDTTHTVTWTIENVSAFTKDYVTLTVEVNSDAKVADATGDTYVVNDADVTVGNQAKQTTNEVENPLDPDEPTEPEKTVDVGDSTTVSVGDTLVYTISYYNNLSTAATVVIEDELDEGVDFISASDDGAYDETTHTVTWTIENVSAFTENYVTLTVEVNAIAQTADSSGNATVVNDADVTVGNQAKQTTDPVENPLDPDDPTVPTKTVDVGNRTTVSVGETLVYTITYYNNLNTTATVVIEDELDEGVDFIEASDGGVYDETTHTVTWTIENVGTFTEGYVTLTVKVNADAKVADENGNASVVNDADVTVGNQAKQTTNEVVNPLDPDEPEDPVKTVDVGDGNAVGIGELITYTIKYYNHNNTAATVTITDVLEDGLTWVSGGTLGSDDKTVTWTIENVAPYTYGSVSVTVLVNSNAKIVAEGDSSASVENTASVIVGNTAAVDTNTVTNPIDPDDPSTPTKAVSADSAAGTNSESVEVGDEITYVISYYNHNNATTTVTITDVLDENVTFVSATNENGYILPDSSYSEADHTVTWTIEAAAYETGTVTVTVKVNDSAAGGKVENTASVQIGNAAAVSTNTVTNDVEEVTATPTPTASSSSNPKTGDDSRLGLWIAILAVGALGLACVTVVTTSRKKRSGK